MVNAIKVEKCDPAVSRGIYVQAFLKNSHDFSHPILLFTAWSNGALCGPWFLDLLKAVNNLILYSASGEASGILVYFGGY